ncbi:hypothetical protein CYMTET_47330 [Cymbomonas tetramitiformis]|uniref:Uncharacterized protein n=1 Tax=Cymbomonas tetramitiformis TaxID=36881 RepID=A0AAE0BUJ6_9CHLO|nr:hypothetical protein CYMTET_47330 [Cymbomonas tetramitiformis]
MIATPNPPKNTFALLENPEPNLKVCDDCETADGEDCVCPISQEKSRSNSDEPLVKAPNTDARYLLRHFKQVYRTHDGKKGLDPLSGASSERHGSAPDLKERLDSSESNPTGPSSTPLATADASESTADRHVPTDSPHTLFESDKLQHVRNLVRDKLISFDTYHVEKAHLRRAGIVEQALCALIEARPLCVEHFRTLADDLRAYSLLSSGMLRMVRGRTLHLEPFETLDLTAKGPLFMEDATEISITEGLRKIGLGDCSLTDELLAPIIGIPTLETLHLEHNPLLEFSNLPTTFPSLKVLNLSECDLADASLEFVKHAPQMVALDISKNPKLTHECVTRLVVSLRLKHLSLAHCTGLTGEIFQHLSNLRYIRTVNLKGCDQLPATATAEYERTLMRNYTEEKWHLFNAI